jgi:hypothetical protein
MNKLYRAHGSRCDRKCTSWNQLSWRAWAAKPKARALRSDGAMTKTRNGCCWQVMSTDFIRKTR